MLTPAICPVRWTQPPTTHQPATQPPTPPPSQQPTPPPTRDSQAVKGVVKQRLLALVVHHHAALKRGAAVRRGCDKRVQINGCSGCKASNARLSGEPSMAQRPVVDSPNGAPAELPALGPRAPVADAHALVRAAAARPGLCHLGAEHEARRLLARPPGAKGAEARRRAWVGSGAGAPRVSASQRIPATGATRPRPSQPRREASPDARHAVRPAAGPPRTRP